MSNLTGCFVAGEADYQYHGANRLGANSLLSCIFGGLVCGVEIPRYLETLSSSYADLDERPFKAALQFEENFKQDLMNRNGKENIHLLHEDLSKVMIRNVTVKRSNKDLATTLDSIKEIRERYQKISLDDRGTLLNQTYIFANQFNSMLELAMIITKGALLRDEFRGSHFKPEFPERDDKNWLKSTIATYDPKKDEPVISYEPIDTPYLKPIQRDYTKAKRVKPKLENIPKNIQLPI
jgi:succinate dehydrogenase / fumarate reductase flavoprotein subunit